MSQFNLHETYPTTTSKPLRRARAAEPYQQPTSLFGIHYTEFTSDHLRIILEFYQLESEPFSSKLQLFTRLQTISLLTKREQDRIRNFVQLGEDIEDAAAPRFEFAELTPPASPQTSAEQTPSFGSLGRALTPVPQIDHYVEALIAPQEPAQYHAAIDHFFARSPNRPVHQDNATISHLPGGNTHIRWDRIPEEFQVVRTLPGDRQIRLPDTLPVPQLAASQAVAAPSPTEPRMECCVCMESLSSRKFPERNITSACQHKVTTCSFCISKSIDTQVAARSWDQPGCTECDERLSYEDVQRIASQATFQRYMQKSFLSAIDQLPSFVYCLGPSCGSGQIHAGGDDELIMTCTTCRFKTCYVHKVPWHANMTCAEYDEQQQRVKCSQDEASEQLLAETTKVCPNSNCGIHVEKIAGCDHITCKKCGYEFCWLCFVDYNLIRSRGNVAHALDCKHHRP